jgi:hypothetical protein
MAGGVVQEAELRRLHVDVSLAFTPSSPVKEPDLFAGRWPQIAQVLGAVGQQGRHVILYGERGVGKTSLAGLTHEFWARDSRLSDCLAVRYDCAPDDTFPGIWASIGELLMDALAKNNLPEPPSNTWRDIYDEIRAGGATPHLVRRMLDLLNRPIIVVVDEFNQLRDETANALFSSTIKSLSDHSVEATIVLVGVANDVDELVAEHESIRRALAQVQMPRMEIREVEDLITKGYTRAGVLADEGVIWLLAKLAQGLPHYGHRFGQEAAFAAIARGSRVVQRQDVNKAIQEAVATTEQSIQAAYQRATYSPQSKTAKYKEVLLACALAPTDDQGYFSAGNLRDPIFRVTGVQWKIPQYVGHLKKFCGPDKGSVLQVTGVDWQRAYRFVDPLLRAYVVLKGMEEGLIEDGDLDFFVYRLGQEPPQRPNEQQKRLL